MGTRAKFQNVWGSFGDGDSTKFGDFGGIIPKKPQFSGMGMGAELPKGSGMVWGQGSFKFRGFWGENPRKSPNFGAGTGERILGIFTTLFIGIDEFFFRGRG